MHMSRWGFRFWILDEFRGPEERKFLGPELIGMINIGLKFVWSLSCLPPQQYLVFYPRIRVSPLRELNLEFNSSGDLATATKEGEAFPGKYTSRRVSHAYAWKASKVKRSIRNAFVKESGDCLWNDLPTIKIMAGCSFWDCNKGWIMEPCRNHTGRWL